MMTRSLAPHHCVFFCSSAVNPKDMMKTSLVPCHRVIFLFKYYRSLRLKQRGIKILIVLLFFILVIQMLDIVKSFFVPITKVRWVFYLFFGASKKFVLFCFVVFATLVDANSKNSNDCWKRGTSFN
jgi:hypothetical protein